MSKFTPCLRALALASVILLAVTGCGSSDDDSATPPGEVSTGSVSGRVADAHSGEAIAGVEVSIGALKATSDANGKYSLNGVPLGAEVVAQFTKPSYASNFATVEVRGAKTSVADRRLAKVAVKQDVSAATGGVVTLAGSPAQVQLPAAGFVNAATGAPFSGTVSVEMTPVDPGVNALNMPGNYRAQGEPVPIESFGALQVELRDSTGALLNLAPGKTATIRIPVPTGAASPPLTIPLYYFKESTGLWVREGTATLAGDTPQQYYEGQVSHFTFWNADQPYETIYINGCVVNAAGQPIDASVRTEGIDYIGSASVSTTMGGLFKVPARRNSQVQVTALVGSDRESVVVTTGNTDVTLPACLVLAQKPPVIILQPVNLTIAPGMLDYLSVTSSNGEQFQWYRNGTPIQSGSRHLSIFGNASGAGSYYVVVTNANGSVTSATVTVTVAAAVDAPVILSHPQGASVLVGAAASFTVQAQGQSLSYRWYRNGVEIPGAQGPVLNLGPASLADNGTSYGVRVSNGAGTAISSTALLSVASEAVTAGILMQPASASVTVGQSAAFSVMASGTGPFTYQWLLNGTNIANAISATYQTPVTALADSGAKYTVRVANAKGNVLSEAATLTVNPASTVAGLHLPFIQGVGANGHAGYGVIPAAGGAAVASFWPTAQGPVVDFLVQAQIDNRLASNLHLRAMLFMKNGQLIRRDLSGANGLPAEVRVSTINANSCEMSPTGRPLASVTGADIADINRSWKIFHKSGADAQCDTEDDRFFAVRVNMGPTDAPLEVQRPVATLHSAQGALTGWLLRNGQQMQRVNADFTNPVTLFTLPADDLHFDDDADLNNHWVFASGGKVYAVDLGATAPSTLTLVATLLPEEELLSATYANQKDVIVAVSNYTTTRIFRYVTTTKAVNTVGQAPNVSRIEAVTPTRVITHSSLGNIITLPLAGGAAQTIYTPPAATFTFYIGYHGGERVWQDMNGSVISVNSDGTGLQTLQGARVAGCILKPVVSLDSSLQECDAIMTIEGNVVRSYDATTAALRVTYGAITAPSASLTSMAYFSFFTAWGQNGVLTQYLVDNTTLNQVVVNYLIKTDQPGVTQIVMP